MSNVISMPLYRAIHRAYPFKNPLVVYSHGEFHDWLFCNVKGYRELRLRMKWVENKYSREIERINGSLIELETLKKEWEIAKREVCDDIRDLSVNFLKKKGYDGVVLEMYLYPPFCDDEKFAKRPFIHI